MAALCSSASNPLTKHLYDDQEVKRDRLVSRNNVIGREEFRSAVKSDHKQTSIDFVKFSSPRILFPLQDFGFQQIPSSQEGSIISGVSGGRADWASEFNNGDFEQINISSKQRNAPPSRSSSCTPTTKDTARMRHGQQYVPMFRIRPANRIGVSATAHGSLGWQSPSVSSSSSQNTTLETQLDDFDWETVFASLETAERAAASQLPLVGAEDQNYMFLDDAREEDASSVPIASMLNQDSTNTVFSVLEKCEVDSKQPISDKIKVQRTLLPTTDYRFQEHNPFSNSLDPFEVGMEILDNDGNLSFAVLAFEAACQKNPEDFDAWRMLGSAQSENERETAAIYALKEALKLVPNSLDIIMRLAISYTNEGTISLAHEYLGQWLERKYPEIPIAEFGPTNYHPTFSQSLERIKEAFIQAAQLSLTCGNIDPDVQVGLGVLLFSAQNYDLAADCFSSAIQTTVPGTTNTQSQLHLLWNRYGACLGNMKKHDGGIEAYEMALAIRPNFVRARYNLGLLYYSKNLPLLSAQNTLQALKAYRATESKARREVLRIVKVGTSHGRLEEIIQRDEPTSIYETLRKCCGSLCRWDLVEAVGPEMDLGAFEKALDAA